MIRFSKYINISVIFSVLAIFAGLYTTFFVHKGFAHSLDFDGGLRLVVNMPKELDRKALATYFESQEIEAQLILLDKDKNHFQIDIGLGAVAKIEELTSNLNSASINEKISVKTSSVDRLIVLLRKDLKLADGSVLSADQVGSVVGSELTSTGLSLMATTLVIMVLYLSFRFQFKFAIAAAVALIHDLIFTIAFIGAFQIKPSVPLIAALLTLLGYSINDTIVVFDRIRENTVGKEEEPYPVLVDISITQTLGRTMNTSIATMVSLVAIWIGGASELIDFAIVLIVGVVIGTYSSIFIAAPITILYEKFIKNREFIAKH